MGVYHDGHAHSESLIATFIYRDVQITRTWTIAVRSFVQAVQVYNIIYNITLKEMI